MRDGQRIEVDVAYVVTCWAHKVIGCQYNFDAATIARWRVEATAYVNQHIQGVDVVRLGEDRYARRLIKKLDVVMELDEHGILQIGLDMDIDDGRGGDDDDSKPPLPEPGGCCLDIQNSDINGVEFILPAHAEDDTPAGILHIEEGGYTWLELLD